MILPIVLSVLGLLLYFPGVHSQQVCNGYAELCNRSFGNVTFIGAHDSAFVSATSAVTANQHYDVTRQLDDGIRLLQSQGHTPSTTGNDSIELCHTECLLEDAGPLTSYLAKVKAWLDENPNEVLTILFTNDDGIPVTSWAADFETEGISELAYTPPFNTTPSSPISWPTLGSMISSGKRVVIFLDSGADQSTISWILPEFTYIWETPFDQTDNSFPCVINRPPSLVGESPGGRMSLVNHFLDTNLTSSIQVPDVSALNVTNGLSGTGSLGVQVQECAAMWGVYPNFLLVDYYDVPSGAVFEVAAEVNGLQSSSTSSTSATVTSGTATETSGSSGTKSLAEINRASPGFIVAQLLLSSTLVVLGYWLM